MKYEILKFKDTGETIIISYQVSRGNDLYDIYNITCNDRPKPSLLSKLLEFREYVLILCEIPRVKDDIHSITVKSLSFSYSGQKHIMGCTITGLRTLSESNSPLVLNTPHKIEDYHSEHGTLKQLLPAKLVKLIYEFQEEVREYIDGEREQMNLFSQDRSSEQSRQSRGSTESARQSLT